MTREKYTISRSPNRWHPSVKGINFDPSQFPDDLEGDQEGTLYLQRSTDGPNNRAGLWMLGAYGGPGAPPLAMELSPQNAVNVLALGADPSGVVGSGAAINRAIQEAKARKYARVYIPAGYYLIDETIVLDSLLWLHGDGFSTVLRAQDQLNAPLIQAYLETDVRWSYGQTLSDMRLDGNRYNQNNSDDYHGVEWISPDLDGEPVVEPELQGYPYQLSTNYDGTWAEAQRAAFNLFVGHCAGTGIWVQGRGASHFHNLHAYENRQYGFRVGYDTAWSNCTAGRNQKAGFYIAHSAVKLNNCKSWWSGYGAPSNEQYLGAGYHFVSQSKGSLLTGCEAQDNWASGYWFDGSHGHICYGCVADSNNRRKGNEVGVWFRDAHRNVFEGMIYDRFNDSYRYQQYSVKITNVSAFNRVVAMTQYSNDLSAGQQYDNKLHPDSASSDLRLNTLIFDNQQGSYAAGTTGGTTQPGVYQGGTVFIDLTENATILAPLYEHVGAIIEYVILNDSTGGWTLAFDSTFRLDPAWSYVNTAGKVNTARFVYTALAKWIMISFANGV